MLQTGQARLTRQQVFHMPVHLMLHFQSIKMYITGTAGTQGQTKQIATLSGLNSRSQFEIMPY